MRIANYLLILTIAILVNASIFAIALYENPVTEFGNFAFSIICHQKEERSFHINGEQLPVCHRCLGIYLGALLGILCFPLFRGVSLKVFLLSLLPMLYDGGTQLIALRESNYIIRLFTGGLAATFGMLYLMPHVLVVMEDCEKFLKKVLRIYLKRFRS